MPVSYCRWWPTTRHGRSGPSALGGTWLGYTIANIWCYGLGVLVITVVGPGTDLVGALLLAQGGLIALGLILIDELDNTYGDLYSGSVSTHSLHGGLSLRSWGTALALVSIAFALVLPMHTLEPFLLMLSSVFVPLFGTILGRLGTQPARLAEAPRGCTPRRRRSGCSASCSTTCWRSGRHSSAARHTLAATFVLGALSARTGTRAMQPA